MTKTHPPRILIITRNLPPLVGGLERLNWHVAAELAKVAEVRVVGPTGCAAQAPAGVSAIEVPLKPLWKFLWHARCRARSAAKLWKPDIVLAGSGLSAQAARSAARCSRASMAVYVHGLDLTVPSWVYRTFWLPAIRRAHRVIANSQATARLAQQAGIAMERVTVVHPGVQIPGQPDAQATARWRAERSLGDSPVLLSVGRLTPRKGLLEFVINILPQIVAKYPKAILLIVGDAPANALNEKTVTPQRIATAAAGAGMDAHVRFLGNLADAELDRAFWTADVHVFPVHTIPDDPEGFGMVAVEAAAHGLSTVAFASGGVVEAVAEGRSGHLIKPGDYSGFADAVLEVLADKTKFTESCRAFAEQFAWPAFGARLAKALHAPPPKTANSTSTGI